MKIISLRPLLSFGLVTRILASLLGLQLLSARAVENHWTGTAGDNLWTDAANWSLGVVPDYSQDVFVEQTGTNAVVLDVSATVASLSLGSPTGPATLNLVGGQFQCYGNTVIVSNAVLNLAADFLGYGPMTVDGTINWTAGSLSPYTIAINPDANFNISGTGSKTLASRVVNDGIVSCFATNLYAFPGFYFTNDNQFVLESDFALSQSPGNFPYPEFHNNGTLLLPAGMGQKTLTLGVSFFNQGTIEVDTNAALQIASASTTAQFLGGSVFDGAGLLRITANSSVGLDGILTVNGTVEFAGNDFYGGWPTWAGSGLLRWTGGTLSGFTFAAGFQAELTGSNDMTFTGICTNLGTVQWQSSGRLLSQGSSGFINLGQFVIETNCVLDSMGWPSGSFTNLGTVLRPADSGTAQLQVNSTPFINQGAIEVDANAVLNILGANGTAQFLGGSVFNGAGLLRIPLNSSVGLDGLLTVNGTVEFAGNDFYGGWPIWTGPGLLRWTGGSMSGFTFAPGLQVQLSGSDDMTFTGICTNLGTVQWQSSGRLLSQGSSGFVNLGQFVIETNCVLDSMSWPSGSFTNLGTVLRPADSGTAQLQVNNMAFVNVGIMEVDTNAVLEILSRGQFQDGTVFDGAGLFRFVPSGQVSLNGTLTVNGTVEYGGNTSPDSRQTWTGPGLLRWTSGGMNGFTFAPGFHVEATGAYGKSFSGGCTNLGTIEWQSSGTFLGYGSPGFVNLGQFIIESNCVLDPASDSSFTNAGIVLRPAGSGTAQLMIGMAFINQGTFEVDTNAVLEILSSGFNLGRFQDGTVFTGTGLLRILPSLIAISGTLTVNGTVEYGGNASLDSRQTWTGPGLLRWVSGGMTGATFAPGFQMEINGISGKSFSGDCTNLGTIYWTGDGSVSQSGGASFGNGGLFLVEDDGNWDATLPFNNQPGGTFQQTCGQFSLGTLNNNGTLKLEHGYLNPGTLASGSSGTYQVSLGGNAPYSGFNQLNAQNLGLDGALRVTLTNGFIPTSGSSFVIAAGTSRTGQFAGVILPPAQSNLTWRVRYTPTEVILQAAPPLAMNGSTHLGDGQFQFTLSGPVAGAYVIEASTNLVDWSIIETNSPFTGNVIFTDPDADQVPHRFYRCQIFN